MTSPQELAAYIAGGFSVISLIFSIYSSKRASVAQRGHEEHLLQLKSQIERDLEVFRANLPRAEVRNKKLFELGVLLQNTCISFDRLVIMSKVIDHEKMLEETANTLGSYTRFQAFFGSSDCYDFPKSIRDSVGSCKRCFAYVFLLLQDDKESLGKLETRNALDEAVKTMKDWIDKVENDIREVVEYSSRPSFSKDAASDGGKLPV